MSEIYEYLNLGMFSIRVMKYSLPEAQTLESQWNTCNPPGIPPSADIHYYF